MKVWCGPTGLSKPIGCRGFITLASRQAAHNGCRARSSEPMLESLAFFSFGPV